MFLQFIVCISILACICTCIQAELGAPAGVEADAVPTSQVLCHTTKGDLTIEIFANWAPLGAANFIKLVEAGFYTDIAMYRSVAGFLTQFGISDKKQYADMHGQQIRDDPNLHIPVRKGYLSYAGSGPNSRSTQIFIAYSDSDFLGKEPWETPFARVTQNPANLAVLDAIHKLGDIKPFGDGPDQQELYRLGNGYIRKEFPQIDFVQSCSILNGSVQVTPENHRRELQGSPVDPHEDPIALKRAAAVHEERVRRIHALESAAHAGENMSGEGLSALALHARKTLAEIKAKKADEDERRARGEIIPEELTPEEIARFERDARKHAHAPMEVPPGEAIFIILFVAVIAAGWQYTRQSLQKDAKRQ